MTLSDSYKVGLDFIKKNKIKPTANQEINVSIKKLEILPVLTVIEKKQSEIKESTLKSKLSEILLKTIKDNNNDKKKVEKVQEEFHEIIENEEKLKDYLACSSTIVSNVKKGRSVVEEIILRRVGGVVGVDCEGVGDKITLVQVSFEGNLFLFDVLTQPGLFGEIKVLLEDASIVKVCFF